MIRWLALALAASPALAADNPAAKSAFEESVKVQKKNSYYESVKKARQDQEEKLVEQSSLIQSGRNIYQQFNNRVRVPGFISASPLPQLARITGPIKPGQMLMMGDTLYVRWAGAPMPRVGDRYATFTPAVVTQNLLNPTDFSVMLPFKWHQNLPKDNRLAGYYYEMTGRVRVIRIKGGLVEVTIEQVSAPIGVGDELMPIPPLLTNVTPIRSGIQLSAAVVCGSPWNRLSTTKRSFIYINRGSRDGIRVGRIFESIENIKLDQSVGGAAPLVSAGEAVVIHTTDSYSTAMITKQFDIIRIGSLLRTMQESAPVSAKQPFEGLQDEAKRLGTRPKEDNDLIPIVPSTDNLPGGADSTLPEPRRAAPEPQLSELDSLEKSLRAKDLTESERSRLDKLSRQEKVRAENLQELEEDTGTPGTPAIDNSFKDAKKSAKKDTKAKKGKKKNDEEELNQLMMEN